jgi:hypothetical protein
VIIARWKLCPLKETAVSGYEISDKENDGIKTNEPPLVTAFSGSDIVPNPSFGLH